MADGVLCERCNTQSILEELLRVWSQLGLLAFVWQTGFRVADIGRRSTQSLLEELLRAWAPLGRG